MPGVGAMREGWSLQGTCDAGDQEREPTRAGVSRRTLVSTRYVGEHYCANNFERETRKIFGRVRTAEVAAGHWAGGLADGPGTGRGIPSRRVRRGAATP